MTRTVLIVSTDYPPLAGTNTRRLEAFARYLPEYGWQPRVLTLALDDMALIESSWQGDGTVETVRVRTPGLQPWARRLRRQRPRRTGGESQPEAPVDEMEPRSKRPVWKRLVGAAWGLAVAAERATYVPDPRRLWAIAASQAALRLAETADIDAVLTSSPPFSAHFVGLRMKRRLGTPWIADFRDLWVGRPYRELPYAWQRPLDRAYEARVVNHVDHLVLASPGWVPLFEKRYGPALLDRTTVITNGYDSGIFATKRHTCGTDAINTKGQPVTIAYTGALHDGESPWPVAKALANVAAQLGADRVRSGLRIRLTGPGAPDWTELEAYLRERDLDGVVQFLGVRSHAESLAEQRAADVLLILSAPPHEETIRGKSFEYMAAGKPILALLPERSTQAQILAPSRLATVVQHGDVKSIAEMLARYLESGVPAVQPNWDYIGRFERRELTGALAEVLNRCAGVVTRPGVGTARHLSGADL